MQTFPLFQITVTDMRKNPDYAIYYSNWARLAVLGIFPALMLIYLNYKVFVQTFTGSHGNPVRK